MSKLRRPENTCPLQNPQQAAAGNPGGVLFEVFERYLRILADLEDIAVGIAHVATPFPAVIVQRLSKKNRSFGASGLARGISGETPAKPSSPRPAVRP